MEDGMCPLKQQLHVQPQGTGVFTHIKQVGKARKSKSGTSLQFVFVKSSQLMAMPRKKTKTNKSVTLYSN